MEQSIKGRLITLLGIIVLALAFLAPTLLPDVMPTNWLSKPVSLGLDLSGGVHLVYEVQTGEAVKSNLMNVGNDIRADLRTKKIPVTKVKANDQNQLELTLLTDRTVDQAVSIIDETHRKELTLVQRKVEDGRATLIYGVSEQRVKEIAQQSVNQAVETLRNRVDKFGVSEPLIQTQGQNRIVLQLAGYSDIESVKRVVGKTAKLEFRLIPTGSSSVGTLQLKNQSGTPVTVEDEVKMGGDAIKSAQISVPDGKFAVQLTMTPEGANTFRKITSENVGRQLAIIMDGVVFSSPVIQEAIPNGSAVISGNFGQTEAKELSVVLRAGALPAPLSILEERTVGPTLGQESIRAGIMAILIGFAMIITYMSVYYKKSGLVATCSLAMNLLISIAALSAFGATLTLPGLAGVALTIGMAVDSNVIIFERIRDELFAGASRDTAVHQGFASAMSAIVDANVTTLLSGIVLYFLGTGSIKGFAVTLTIGVLSTIFCATFFSRLLFDLFSLKNSRGELSI